MAKCDISQFDKMSINYKHSWIRANQPRRRLSVGCLFSVCSCLFLIDSNWFHSITSKQVQYSTSRFSSILSAAAPLWNLQILQPYYNHHLMTKCFQHNIFRIFFFNISKRKKRTTSWRCEPNIKCCVVFHFCRHVCCSCCGGKIEFRLSIVWIWQIFQIKYNQKFFDPLDSVCSP